MNTTRAARLIAAGFAVALIPTAGAHAQDCVAVAAGSSAGQPEPCVQDDVNEDFEVQGEVVERETQPAPEPEAAPTLAATGASSSDLAIAGAAALGAGGVLLLSVRRRRELA